MSAYFLLSVPYSSGIGEQSYAQFNWLLEEIGDVAKYLHHFEIPPLKARRLDSLLDASDELNRLDTLLESASFKLLSLVVEVTKRPRSSVAVVRNTEHSEVSCDSFLKNFRWDNSLFYPAMPPTDLIASLSKRGLGADERMRRLLGDFNDTRQKIVSAERREAGNYAVRPIGRAVEQWRNRAGALYPTESSSEFLCTLFVAVSVAVRTEWNESYWKASEFIVPQSASMVVEDKDYIVFAVVVLKWAADDVMLSWRRKKYLVRKVDSEESAEPDLDALKELHATQNSELTAQATEEFSRCFTAWAHLKAARVFVESTLKYGLSRKFLSVLVAVDPSKEQAVRKRLAPLYQALPNPFPQESFEFGALQQEYPYVSIKVNNIVMGR